MVTAITMTYADEAVGLTRAAEAAGMPVAISFTVETDGRLPSGQPLGEAIEQVDAETDSGPAYYMVNCAHPTHFDGCGRRASWTERIRGLRANASTKSHAELDEATELDAGDPADLAARYAALARRYPTSMCSAAAAAPTPGTSRRSRRRGYREAVSQAAEQTNRLLLRARDTIDRDYAGPLDVPALARVALMSEAHFIREFHAAFGEPPHRYLQRRRVERAMFLLTQTGLPIMDVCLDVGFTSLGTFGRTFRDIVGRTPTQYRQGNGPERVPACFTMTWSRPSSLGEANGKVGE